MDDYPIVDVKAARTLGAALRRVGFDEEGVEALVGDAYERDEVVDRRLPRTKLATVIRSILLVRPVPTDDLVRALGRGAVDALEALGLAEVDAEVMPRVRITPVGDLLLASDDPPCDVKDEPTDYVAAYTPTSRLCAAVTPRRRVARALDVGCGSGVQALFAAQCSEHVVAIDLNERALRYTAINAALSNLTNVECRQGSFFEPVTGETFDSITCNAPYVVSPEHRLTYRDSGLEGDAVSELVVRESAAHLAEGGFATVLVSWIATDEDELDAHVLAWADATGCSSWILAIWDDDPVAHAAGWNSENEGEAFETALDEWTSYLDRFGATRVTEGAVVLHRRSDVRPTARVDDVDAEELDDAGDQIERAFAARARLEELRGAEALLDAILEVAMPLSVERELEPTGSVEEGSAWVRLEAGTHSVVESTLAGIELLPLLDGKTSLRALLGNRSSRDAIELVRTLLELGALRFAR